jgi:hypothetical protein
MQSLRMLKRLADKAFLDLSNYIGIKPSLEVASRPTIQEFANISWNSNIH